MEVYACRLKDVPVLVDGRVHRRHVYCLNGSHEGFICIDRGCRHVEKANHPEYRYIATNAKVAGVESSAPVHLESGEVLVFIDPRLDEAFPHVF